MKLIVDIPEDEYQNILLTGKASFCAVNAIEAGTPFPEGLGIKIASRLVDDVLDKIRTEVEQLPITDTAVSLVAEILDKYKAESEE